MIILGAKYGVYTPIEELSKRTGKGYKQYLCKCDVCGKQKKLSELTLRMKRDVRVCSCDKTKQKEELTRLSAIFNDAKGNLNLCGGCIHCCKCVVFQNIVDKSFMKKWHVEQVGIERRNIVLVTECDKFQFDWGEGRDYTED